MAAIKKIFSNFINNTTYGNSLTSVLRIAMGMLFIYSGFFKALDPENFGRVIILYDISPEILMPYAAIIFPYIELVIGLLLFFGFRIKASSFLAIILMIFWIIIIGISIFRGKSFDCGCFELQQFGISEEIGWALVLRDIVFLIVLLLIFYARKHILSIDKAIEALRLRNL
jgi:putative oxidoreductase